MAKTPGVEPLPTPPVGRPILSRARRTIGILMAVVVVGTSTAAVVRSASAENTNPGATAQAPAQPVTTTSTPPSPAPEAEAETEVPAPVAPTAAAPAAPRVPEKPLVALGEIRIPKIGLVHPIYEGVTLDVVDHGPGHWPGSAVPGQLGNAVFAGHRVTHSHPFRDLDQMAPGDEIVFSTRHGVFTYRMTSLEIVSTKDTWIAKPTPDATLTLFACHPPGSAKQRIVVRGVLTSSVPA